MQLLLGAQIFLVLFFVFDAGRCFAWKEETLHEETFDQEDVADAISVLPDVLLDDERIVSAVAAKVARAVAAQRWVHNRSSNRSRKANISNDLHVKGKHVLSLPDHLLSLRAPLVPDRKLLTPS